MKQLITTLALCLSAFTFLQAQSNYFTIRGNFKNMPDHYTLLLFNTENGEFKTDTLKAHDGVFNYTGQCQQREPRIMMLMGTEEQKQFKEKSKGKSVAMYGSFDLSFFVHPGADIELSGDINDFPFINLKDSKNSINEDYIAVKQLCTKAQKEINHLHYVLNEARWNNDRATMDNNRKRMAELNDEINQIQKEWINNHLDSEYAAYLYSRTGLYQDSTDKLEAQYKKFAPAIQQSEYGKLLADRIKAQKTIVAGAQAPAFTMKDINTGKDVSLADYKGKYLIIDFWGSWCGPCRASHPHLIQLYKQYKGDKFDIIGIAADHKDDVIKEAAEKDGLLWTQVNMYEKRNGQEPINKLYNISAYPTKLLINPKGIIEAIYIGDTKEIDNKLKELLGN